MKSPYTNTRIEEELAHAVAEFLNRESNRQTLITVTRVALNEARTILTVFVSVFPETEGEHTLEFLSRVRHECHEYLLQHTRPGRSLGVRFELDAGEANRRRIDELTETG